MARRRSSRARKRAKKQGKGGLTLDTVVLLAYMFFVLIFAIALWFSQQAAYSQIHLQQRTSSDAISRSVSFQLSRAAISYAYALESMARDPALISLMKKFDDQALAKRAAQLHKVFPYAIALRIFRAGTARLDNTTKPPIGYACLDLLTAVARGEMTPLIEVHSPNTKQQHIEIVRPVLSGTRVIGYIQLALDIKAANIWLYDVVGKNYVEVIQKSGDQANLLLGKAGNADLKTSKASYYSVEGTRWKVAVWSPASISILPITLEALLIFFLAVTLLGVVVFMLKRSVSDAISTDAINLIGITKDILYGSKQHGYHLHMPEFIVAARSIDNLKSAGTIDRERDDDPNAISVGSGELSDIGSVFSGSGGVSVEELDESSVSSAMRHRASQASDEKAMFESRELSAPEAASTGSMSAAQISQSAPAPAMPPPEIFKAYDIRGIVGATLTAQHAQLIGQAIGSEAIARGLKKMAFARDGRLSGPELGKAFVQGVQQTGVDVVDIGMVPTPVLYYAAIEKTGGTGVMLTGSHNPPNYNGFKMMLGGDTLAGEQIQAIRERIEANDFVSGSGQYINESIAKQYLKRILNDVKPKRQLSVVIDCGNGVAGVIAPTLFKTMGCIVTELYCDVDGNFPNHHPDPSNPENLQDLIAMVKSKRADVGLAFDGDGDRLGVVDSAGNIIYPDRYMMLFAADVLSRNHGAQIIYDIKCSSNLTKHIWEKGGEPVMWKTGHSFMKAKLKQSGAALAGEMSGHIFFKERWYGFDDGMYAGARLLEILAGINKKSAEVFAKLPDAVNTPEINVPMKEGEHHKFVDELMVKADFGDANVTMIDGIRADFADGWGLVRASNTTPVLVLRFEGKDKTTMQKIQHIFKTQMLAVKPDLKLPF